MENENGPRNRRRQTKHCRPAVADAIGAVGDGHKIMDYRDLRHVVSRATSMVKKTQPRSRKKTAHNRQHGINNNLARITYEKCT